MNGHHQNMRIAAPGSTNGQKADPANPIARKLVYNAYREMLSKKHADANVIVDNAPQELVTEDQGIVARVESMMRQQSELKGGNMHAGGPPPPPPPPPIPGIIPASRLPSELSSQVSTMNQPPAALASAMMKERKPFTYTPGGLDLSEISNQPNQNGNGVDQADFGVPFQSRSFRVLQTVLDHQDTAEPQGPVHIPSMRQNVQQPSQQQPQPNQFQQQPVYQQHSGSYQQPGVNNAASVEQTAPEPKKYMGGNIPSRSFRMLQAMTASDDATDAGEPANTPEPTSQPNDDTQHAANQISSPNGRSSSLNSPSSLSPSITHTGTNDISSDSGISSPSKINSYMCVKDSKVYRNVSPKIMFNGTKDRVVNSALSNAREPSSPTWKISPQNTAPFNQSHSELDTAVVDGSGGDQDSPRLLKIIREESVSPNPRQEQCIERRYEGGHIPSRVFRHLQSEYSGDSNELQEPKSRLNSKSPSPRYEGGSIPPRVLRSIQNEANTSFESDTTDGENASRASSSMAELDEYYHNGMAHTAVNKDTVLKELTSQFDQAGIRKKPKAAPGRVFRYLQAQYDTPEEFADQQNTRVSADASKQEQEATTGFGYRGPKVPSPSFRFLQNQYSQQEEQPVTEEVYIPNAPELKEEPTPYHGCRVPGRTFRSLQDNVATHPSVLKPRK